MRRYIHISILVSAILLSVLTGCTRRPLDMEYIDSAELTVIIDWSKAQLDPNGNTIAIYPADGSSPQIKLSHSDTIKVPLKVGFYSIIAINETFEDFDYVSFRNTDHFETIEAYVEKEGANKAGEIISADPDIVAVASLGEFHVTTEMVEITRSKTKTKTKTKAEEDALVDAYPELKLVLTPERVVYPAVVTANVVGLDKVSSAGAYVTGFTEGVFLATGKTSIYATTQKFSFTERKFNAGSSTNGYLRGTFHCFGLREKENDQDTQGYSLGFRSILIDNSNYDVDRDISHNISQVNISIGVQIEVSLGAGIDTGDTPIVIPDVQGAGSWDVKVGEWDDVIIPIEL